MAEAKTVRLGRFLSLFLALLGFVVVAVPMMYPSLDPTPLILIGCGVTVVASAGYFFLSLWFLA